MKLLYFILHGITGCKNENLESFRDKKTTCRKCGRTYFIFQKY